MTKVAPAFVLASNSSLSSHSLRERKTAMAAKLCFFFLLFSTVSASSHPDLPSLLDFKSTSDSSNVLSTWTSDSSPCSFAGVSCTRRRVTRVVLEKLNLHGSFAALCGLSQLRVLSLKNNRLSGTVPDVVSNLTSLKLLFLSRNSLSGDLPLSLTSLSRLYRLDLSHNGLTGDVPGDLNRLTHLLTLRLESNQFSGEIPSLDLPSLQDFNVSGNRLSGEIPTALSAFSESAFAGNLALCGASIQKCNSTSTDSARPGDGAIASPVIPSPVVTSSPTTFPSSSASSAKRTATTHSNKLSPAALIGIVVGDIVVLVLVSLVVYCYFWRNLLAKMRREGKNNAEKIVYSSSPYSVIPNGNNPLERGQMVFFEGVRRFELENLLRASAEMLGKGGFGTAYKAVLDDGNVVAVKRLKDAHIEGNSRTQFEQHMAVLGRLSHRNVVSLRAYYFAREEKLLVYDYMPNGSLFWLLHGNRGPGRTPLDWTTRLKIAAGAARGLAFIHSSCAPLKLTHGNIKSTNVLLDKNGNARVSDFGLVAFSPSLLAPRLCGYRAPEVVDGRKVTQKSDVYGFGVLLLEMLTGKCPSAVGDGGTGGGYGGIVDLPRWVQSVVREEWTAEVFDLELMRYKDIEEEMVGLLQVAMACTAALPDQWPIMSQVVKMIDEIRGVAVSPPHEGLDSMTESPALFEDTCSISH